MIRLAFTLLCITVPLLKAEQKCQPDSSGVRRYNGKPCASTTRYVDGHRGACGCGPANTDTPYSWNVNDLVVAASQKYFDNGGNKQWCGANCGKCVRLTPTGGFVQGQGNAPPNLASHVFMVTNDCPIAENQAWCGQSGAPGSGQHNQYGYEVHFDLQDQNGQANRLGWNNPEVTWEATGCPGDLSAHYGQCECSHSGK